LSDNTLETIPDLSELDNINLVRPKLDIIFKKMMSDKELLRSFLSNALKVAEDSIKEIEFLNTEILPENSEGKLSRMDLRLDVDGRSINCEIQVNKQHDYADRVLYLWARLFGGGLERGEPYGKLKESICINIVGFEMFSAPEYHSHFTVMETTRHEVLSDKCGIYFFDLTKIHDIREKVNIDDKLELWLQLINAETEEEFDMLEQTGVVPIQKAVSSIHAMRRDRAIRQAAFDREIDLHDEATRMEGARRDGKAEGKAEGILEKAIKTAISMLKEGIMPETVAKCTELPLDQVRQLQPQ